MSTKDDIRFAVGADTDQFNRKIDKAQQKVGGFGDSVGRMAKTSAVGLAALGAAAAASLGVLVAQSLQTNDALAKTADSLGITTEALAGLRHAADLTGVSQEKLDKSVQVMTKNIAEAAIGIGEARTAMSGLGLDAQALAKLSPDQQFAKIAGAMGDVTNSGERVRIAMKLFGEEGAGLINTLKLGETGLAAMAKEAEVLGISVSRVDAAKMEAANDAMTRAGGVVKGLGNEVAAKVAPLITGVANGFTDWAVNVGGFEKAVDKGFGFAVNATGVLLDAFYPVELTFSVLKLGALSLGSSLAQAMAAGGSSVSSFLTDFMTPFRVSIIGVLQLLAGGMNTLADFGLVTESAAASVQAMADSWSGSIDRALQFDPSSIQALADGMAAAVDEQGAKITELVNGPARSEQLAALVSNMQVAAQQTAAAVAAGAAVGTQAIGAEMVKRSDLENYQYQQTLLKDQEFFTSFWIPSKDLQDQIMLDRAELHENALTDTQKAATQERINQAKREAQARQQAMQGMMSNLTSLMTSGNKTMFEVGKKAAIAETVIGTISSAQKSFDALADIPYVGPALGAAAAAVAIASGMARVNQIKSQRFGGAGSVSAAGGGGFSASGIGASTPASTTATAPTPAPDDGVGQGQLVQFVFNGPVSGNDARKLIADMAEIINTEDMVLINPTSRNGQELSAAAV